jgi:outer membrane protein OmpA-like peptidoglycan-associated protein/tetratricopeptide (TPR) repeat protein
VNKNCLLILLLIIGYLSFGQNVEFEKDNFPNQKDGFKTAYNNLLDGNDAYEKENYYNAIESFLQAFEFNAENSQLNFKIGVCYLQTSQRFMCLKYFEKAFRLDRNVDKAIHYMLGRGYHLNYKFELAANEYRAHLGILSPSELKEEKPALDKLIEECELGKQYMQNPARAFVDNLPAPLNSKFHDHSPLISADESLMVFTSTRDNNNKMGEDGHYDEDIYLITRTGKLWNELYTLGEPINTQYNDATVGLSPDGQKLLIFNGNRGDGDIEECLLDGDAWNYPKAFPKTINSDYRETAACYSSDGKVLYFISDRPGGFGGSDIYYSRLNSKGKWDEAQNMGSVINSAYNEETVFMHPDGRTLYFSSEGHSSMGGFDIFVTHLEDNGQWSLPMNMGYPINSPDDDLCFVISANGKHGYCSSVRKDGLGGYDIYKTTFLGPEKPPIITSEDNLIAVRTNPLPNIAIKESVAIKTIRLTIVKGIVKDGFTNDPIAAEIEIVDNEKNEVIYTSNTNSSTGRFLVSLPSGKNYGLAVKAEDYLFHSENFNIPTATQYQELEKEIVLHNVKKDAKIVLKNVFFETGSAKLKPTSYAELGRLSKLLEDHPKINIEISGHTDNKGSYAANKKLSQNRAKAVVDFLIQLGIKDTRLSYVGHAYDFPVADNATEDGRQQNRRVEFKVL